MPRNIEIKARIPNIEALELKVSTLATEGPFQLIQDDTFFRCTSGRLKLRTFDSNHGELIYYQRDDLIGPKESFYIRSQTSQPEQMLEALTFAYGVAGRVRKLRTVYIIRKSRVHLDRLVIGNFLEIEVVLSDEDSTESGIRTAHDLLGILEINQSHLIDVAYIDLINATTLPD